MPAEPIPSLPFPPPSDHNRPYVIQEANPTCVIHDVIQGVSHTPIPVSQAVSQPGYVSHNQQDPQLNSVKQDRDTTCITNGKPRITRRAVHPIATRMNARKDWVQGLGTAKFIAQKYGLAYSTIRSWYQQDDWTSARKQWIKNQMIAHAPVPQPITIPPIAPASPLNAKVQMIESQLEALDLMLAKAKTPEDWQKLTNSKDKLLQNYYVLAGIAKPAARKAGKSAPQRVQPIEPVEPGNP